MQMSTPKKMMHWVLLAGFVASLAVTGCTKRPNEEQLLLLEETRQAALAAEQKAQQCDSEKSSVSDQLSQKKRELQKAKDEMEAVKQRLGQ